MKQTLVTGAAGFIGSHVVRALLADGHAVRALHLPGEDLRNLAGLDIELLPGDITDAEGMRAAVLGCDWVFHLAAIYALWLPNPQRVRDVNVEGTRKVLQAAADAGVSRVVHTSSIAVFGGQGPQDCATEESSFALGNTGDLYSRTKYESHQLALEFARDGLDLTIVAPCVPIGPGDVGPTPTGKVLMTTATMPAPFVVDMCSNFADVRDMARGHVLAAERGVRGEAYLLGHENYSAKELAQMALTELGLKRPVMTVPLSLADMASRAAMVYAETVQRAPLVTPATVAIARLGLRARCDKAVRELGMPQRPVRESIRDALVWWAEHGYIPERRARLLV
jgi:dihydroflavonol-4-reductase